jgi:cellulose synthase/poly-beta-1,6-N-acetylglucosamine synthase-like glycosyltransferase
MSGGAIAVLAVWSGLALITFVFYPLAVLVLARLRPPRAARAEHAPSSVSIVICAHNEAGAIREKLESMRPALAAWSGHAEILLADDASRDGTADLGESVAGLPLTVLRLQRGGKAAAINQVLPRLRGDILVFTDADPLWEPGTLEALLAPFADGEVGAVAGSVEVMKSGATRFGLGDRLFRRYENLLRSSEDRLFGTVSADGGLLAIRRALMPHVVPDATDDFYISTAAVAAGQRIAFAPDARVWEHSIGGDRQQLRRRIRITVRGLTGLWRRRALMNPMRHGGYALALIFHKLLRRFLPMFLPLLWLALGALAADAGGAWTFAFAFATAAGIGACLLYLTGKKVPKPLKLSYFLLLHSSGLAAGAFLFLAGRRYTQWQPQKAPEAQQATAA